MEMFNEFVTVNNKQGTIIRYIGSELWKVAYLEGNKRRVVTFHETEIDFHDQDLEHLKKVHR